jgi:hypothetical protein
MIGMVVHAEITSPSLAIFIAAAILPAHLLSLSATTKLRLRTKKHKTDSGCFMARFFVFHMATSRLVKSLTQQAAFGP